MKINNVAEMAERIGDYTKDKRLKFADEVEEYLLFKLENDYDTEADYDVIANELPYFKTFNYTEYANCITIHPLQLELRVQQMMDAYADNAEQTCNYVEFFKENVLTANANKYNEINKEKTIESRKAIVVLPGSNKLKDRIDINKLKYCKSKHGSGIWFKPHPLTSHTLIGEIKDRLGEEVVLERCDDLYSLLVDAEIVYTSVLSESAAYAVALGKQIEPIDIYNTTPQGSFNHINRFLFRENNPQEWVNRTFNSPKSGIICPMLDENWRQKVDAYLEYIHEVRASYKNKYLYAPQKKR